MGETVLRTARLLLRPARADDLTDLFAIMSDHAVMRFWSQEAHRDPAETQVFLERMIARNDRGLDFVLEHEGRAVGKAGAFALPEVGFLLHPGLWGRGLVREAMEAIVPHLFASTDVTALTADVDPRNRPSLRVLERLGFRETGRAERTFFLYGEWADSVYLALPRPGMTVSSSEARPAATAPPG